MEPFIGEISLVGFNFAPRSWALCDGQLLAIASNTALFSLIGTTFGGDGRTTFALPDLRGRTSMHVGYGAGLDSVSWGERGGLTSVTLNTAHMPSHSHGWQVTGALGTTSVSANNRVAGSTAEETAPTSKGDLPYTGASLPNSLASTTIGNTGGGQSMAVQQPYLGIYHIIALFGIYPSRS